MKLIVFIVFQLLMEVQCYESPTVKVYPDVITESSSVKIICETPAGHSVNQCYFYTNREENNIKSNWKCELDLTGAEVFRWAAVKSHGLIIIYCYYTVLGTNETSPHSPPVTVSVRVSPSTNEQTTTAVMKTFSPSTTTEQNTTIMKTSTLPVLSTSETITYSTNGTITNSTSPGDSRIPEHIVSSMHTSMAHPDTHTVTTSTSMAITSTTASPTTDTRFIVLVSTAVILSGLTVCLCWFACKKSRKQSIKKDVPSQGISMSCSKPAEIYSLITSVPETSQPISEGLEHPESHQESIADPTESNSFIMSVNSIYPPSDVLANKQQKHGNQEDSENVYHLYSTIPDKPAHAQDHVYSLLGMN